MAPMRPPRRKLAQTSKAAGLTSYGVSLMVATALVVIWAAI
jgi:hypothetical protein